MVRIDEEPSRRYRSSAPHSAISQTPAPSPPSTSDRLNAAAASPQTVIAPHQAIIYYDAFWQTLCASVVPPKISSETTQVQLVRIRDSSTHRLLHDARWTSLITYGGYPTKVTSVCSACTLAELANFVASVPLSVSTGMRQHFVADGPEHEWLGLAPANTQVGDRVALFEGGQVPCIIWNPTWRASDEEKEKEAWEMVRDAYVYGIMDG
jgi:hypothetical protein